MDRLVEGVMDFESASVRHRDRIDYGERQSEPSRIKKIDDIMGNAE